tara:strand:+ start:299 stop:1021 length:723 start_codon:yes stop_codon:yes gene_type:complete
MVFKKNNPGCPCCPCPCYRFEGNGKDSFGNKDLTESGTLYSTTSAEGSQSARFTGSSYFQREKQSCFTPYGHTTWTISFNLKIVTLPTLTAAGVFGNTMGVVTRASFSGVLPTGTFSGEWGIFYEHRETGGTFFFGLKTDTTTHVFPDKGGGVLGEAIDDQNGDGVNGFYTVSWTIGPGSASVVTVGASTTNNTYSGNLVSDQSDDLYVGNNTEGLKLGEDYDGRDGGEFLIDNLCFSVT